MADRNDKVLRTNWGGANPHLNEDLTELAKETILKDIRNKFKSNLILPEAQKDLINSYLSNKESLFDNRNKILVSLLREVIEKGYSHKHYKDYVKDIIEAIIEDLEQ